MAKSKDKPKKETKSDKVAPSAAKAESLPEKKEKRVRHIGVKVAPCVCKHAYQDSRYGANMRVFNPRTPKGALKGFRCTVCGTTTER